MVKKIKAIEYNVYMTIIKMLTDRIQAIITEFNIDQDIHVIPAYPTNLTDMKKPSIIVRKIDSTQKKIGLGNFLGQYYNSDDNSYSDVFGKQYNFSIQIDIATDNNTSRALLESIISDEILNNIAMFEGAKFDLLDFTGDIDNPQYNGELKIIGDPSIRDIFDKDATNKFYLGCIRQDFSIIQSILPQQEYVDLTKWIKQTYTITV